MFRKNLENWQCLRGETSIGEQNTLIRQVNLT